MSISVPATFVTGLVAAEGEEQRAWLDALPALAQRYLARWRLTLDDGKPMHGMGALVLPVRTASGQPAVLKLTWPHPEAEHEGLALRHWQSPDVVRVLDADEFVLLLERLDHTRSLNDAPLPEAVDVCAGFLRSLAIAAPPSIRTLAEVAKRWVTELPSQSAGVVPDHVVAAAVAACERFGPIARPLLTNEDLHYENVLGRGGSWVMIDPKPIAGDPEFSVLPLLWNRFGEDDVMTRYETIVREAGLDAERARAWTLARAVDNWIYDELSTACRAVGLALAG